jgi:hypothetical protein
VHLIARDAESWHTTARTVARGMTFNGGELHKRGSAMHFVPTKTFFATLFGSASTFSFRGLEQPLCRKLYAGPDTKIHKKRIQGGKWDQNEMRATRNKIRHDVSLGETDIHCPSA